MTDNQYQQTLQRNKMIAQTSERAATYIVRFAVDAFRAVVKFIQELVAQALGK